MYTNKPTNHNYFFCNKLVLRLKINAAKSFISIMQVCNIIRGRLNHTQKPKLTSQIE